MHKEKDSCSGCQACVNVCPCDAIEFKTDEFGFGYPAIDEEKCVNCNQCVSACNSMTEDMLAMPRKAFSATIFDKKKLMCSSSGGVFSVVAEYVLENGGAVCGCVYDSALKPVHICTEKEEEYLKMRKSKYVQSDVGHIYNDVKKRLKEGQMVLFSGTPCQVAALYAVLGEKNDKLITMDLVCHGVPSQLMFAKFLQYLEKKYKTKIVGFDFRSKKYGWQRFTMEFTDEKGKVKNIGKANEFYMPAFSAGYIMRPSCFSCKYACAKRIGDITVGDFWGHEYIDSSCDTSNGVSVCTFNTEASMKLIPIFQSKLFMEEIDYQVAVNGNTCLRHPTFKGEKWEYYMKALKNDDISALAKRYKKNNRKKILRFKLKMLVPVEIFKYVKKHRIKKQKNL